MNIPDARNDDAAGLWTICSGSIRPQVSDAVWQTTFNAIQPLVLDEEQFVIAVPSLLVKERIEGRYLGLLRDALADADMAEIDLMILVETEPATDMTAAWAGDSDSIDLRGPHAIVIGGAEGDPQPVSQRYTFDAFVTGTSNRFAQAAALAVAETPARSYNPLFIYGAAGLGKTHLLHAIGHHVKAVFRNKRVRYVSTETFMNEFVDAIRAKTMPAFKRRYRDLDVLLIDDIQFLERTQELQEEFFHTFNQLHNEDGQIVISSDRPPKSIATLEDRLRSRFEWGLITDV